MKTKSKVLLTAVWLVAAVSALANAEYIQTFTPADGTIQAGNMVGQVFTGDFTAAPNGSLLGSLTVTVALNVSGGYDGDFFALLAAPNGTTDLLLNRPGEAVNGFGASGSGLNIMLDDRSPNGSIQQVTSSSALTGSYQPALPLSILDGSPADGNWTLFFADEGSGGGDANLNSWSVVLATPVPEVVTTALYIAFGFGAMQVFWGIRWLTRRGTRRATWLA